MIPLDNLRYLSAQKVKDAQVLFRYGRNNGAIYLMGYALEFSLKRKISQTFGFAQGFPETGAELNTYTGRFSRPNTPSTGIPLPTLRQIRHHRLNDLLTYSGMQPRITASYYPEWLIVANWNPENRYLRTRVTKKRASDFIRAAKLILAEIS